LPSNPLKNTIFRVDNPARVVSALILMIISNSGRIYIRASSGLSRDALEEK
jgi:hypothetical protein